MGNTLIHQSALREIGLPLVDHVETNHLGEAFLGPVTVRLSPHDHYLPDFSFVGRDRRHLFDDDRFVNGPPNLLGEVLSLFSANHDRAKAAIYARFGVAEYWLVDPERQAIDVLILRDGVYVPVELKEGVARSIVVPGFAIKVKDVFREPAWTKWDED